MFARIHAEESRPIDDQAPIREFPKYGRPLVYVGGIYGKAVGWTRNYGLIEWLDSSGTYPHWVGTFVQYQAGEARRVEGCRRTVAKGGQ